MRMEWKQAVLFVAGVAVLGSAASPAQTSAAGQTNTAPPAPARAGDEPQFSIGIGVYGAFNQSTTGNGTQQTTTNSGGGILEVRYIDRPLAGVEFTYSYNPANQTIAPSSDCSAHTTCADPKAVLNSKASTVGLDYVASRQMGALRPFAAAGLGFFITSPPNSTFEVQTVVRPDFIVGGGLDWAAMAHLGLRVQVRDNIYKAPNLSSFNPPTGQYTHTLQPTGGLYYSF